MSGYYERALREFRRLFGQICKAGVKEPTAVVLATADRAGRPSIRTVLLKGVDDRGFVFYTNLKSRKGKDLAANPRAALCFYWEPLGMQVIVEGRVKPVSSEEADAYWKTRPRQSQIGAWVSKQSSPLKNRLVLFSEAARAMTRFAGRPVPRPSHWSGLRVVPDRIEFWKRKPFRLHERRVYRKRGKRWVFEMLYP
ncbi:MAG: pyridoxamine 5'-phosphate oxidase [Candidatus Omnitrophica bacterium]|nr:pyridoxamine 5'-phosphate oxidase [Candidatus Omnitrophota bacterium]